MQTQFNEAEFAKYAQKGTATITGQAFAKTQGGDVKYGAGNQITLVPGTRWVEEYARAINAGYRLPPEPRLSKHLRQTVGDGSGNFEFKDLPAGQYFVECEIYWQIPSGYRGGTARTGAALQKRVTVAEGESIKVMLTP